MFGLEGIAVPLGFALTLLSTVLCVIYGVRNWNQGALKEDEIEQRQAWIDEEKHVEESL